jgi:3-oxoadipate enol-lactonase
LSSAPLVLVHAGVCDSRMWDPLEPLLSDRHEIRRHEMRGFGDSPPPAGGSFSPAADLEAELGGPAVLVGASFGGQVCLELAARRPELVAALVLLDAPLPDHGWSDELEAYGAEEERLLEAGELDAVTELNVAFWAGRAQPTVKEAVRVMQRRSLELQAGLDFQPQEPESIEVGRITAPALVVTGERDHEDFQLIADRLAAELPNARRAVVEGAGHLPALEQPEQIARLVLDFVESG